MKQAAISVVLLLAALAPLLCAAPSAVEKAESALRDGFPQAAITPLEEALRKASPKEKRTLGLLLARAQLDVGNPAEAQRTLEIYGDRDADETLLLRAAALAAQGHLAEAAKIAEPRAATSPEAALLLARIRLELHDIPGALALLSKEREPLPESPNTLRLLLDLHFANNNLPAVEAILKTQNERPSLPQPELDTTRGRLLLAQSRPSDAAEAFRRALDTPDLPAPVRDNARLGLAKALITLGIDARARDVLYEALNTAPDAFTTRENMALWLALEHKLGADPSPALRTWSSQDPGRRTFEARLQSAGLDIRAKRPDLAVSALNELATEARSNPQRALRIRLLAAEAHIAAGQPRRALELLDEPIDENAGAENRYRIADLQGRALAALGNHHSAYEAFAKAMTFASNSEESAASATNALLSALAANDAPLARKSYEALAKAAPAAPDLVRWAFLIAVAEAKNGNPDSLAALARRAPAVEYAFQSKIALAEWHLARGDTPSAERILRTAGDEADNEQRGATLAAAEIFTSDNAGSLPQEDLLAACKAFLEKFPQAPEAVDVAFKAAELHSRAGDHASAESILSKLAEDIKIPETAALAKFLAAQSAAKTMSAEGAARAMAWFDEIAQGASALRHRARFEQASILLREGRFQNALTLYDRILAADSPPEVRLAALMEKGDTLFAMGTTEPARFAEASELYRSIANEPGVPPDWRDQATCKMAAALAQSGQISAALAAYREVLARAPDETASPFWFQKAGFEAGRLLEKQQDWPAAIAVYDRMAEASGSKHEEFKQRARRLRLEHFIWEN